MKIHRLFFFASLLAGTAGCPTRDKYDGMPSVTITTPTTGTYANGVVHIDAVIHPAMEVPIVIRRSDGVEIATITPSEGFDWNTTTVPEGAYAITAEVVFSN